MARTELKRCFRNEKGVLALADVDGRLSLAVALEEEEPALLQLGPEPPPFIIIGMPLLPECAEELSCGGAPQRDIKLPFATESREPVSVTTCQLPFDEVDSCR